MTKARYSREDATSPDICCTWYMAGEHIPAKTWTMSWARSAAYDRFDILFYALFDFPEHLGAPCSDVKIAGEAHLDFNGVYVSRHDLFPKAIDEDDARKMVAPFFEDIENFRLRQLEDEDGWPIPDERNFVFVP